MLRLLLGWMKGTSKNYEDLNQGKEWKHIKRAIVLKNSKLEKSRYLFVHSFIHSVIHVFSVPTI